MHGQFIVLLCVLCYIYNLICCIYRSVCSIYSFKESCLSFIYAFSPRQDQTVILGEISPIFRIFSTYGTPLAVFLPTCLTEFAYFRLFLPILCLKWYPILVINSSMVPICCFSAHMFTDSVYFLPNLPPIFAGPVLPPLLHFIVTIHGSLYSSLYMFFNTRSWCYRMSRWFSYNKTCTNFL